MSEAVFWNQSYEDGFDYRQVGIGDVEKIVSVVKPKPRVLDVGCGTGDLARQLHELGCSVTGVDLSDVAVRKAKEKSLDAIDYRVLDIESVDLVGLGKFDIAIMKLVFAFIKDKGAVITKIKELLRPGGILAIINPVVTDYTEADQRTKRISVDDDVTMQVENFGLTLYSKSSTRLSEYHQLTTYVFKS